MKRSARRNRRAGYTIIEVMMAIGVLTAGAVGIMALIQASTRGNMEARQMSTGTMLASRWVERLRRDGLNWTRSTQVADPTLFNQTQYFDGNVPAAGTAPAWFVPVPDATSGETANFDYYGQDTTDPVQMRYCTNVRLEWLYLGNAVRADVRVWWLRNESGIGAADATRTQLAQCAPGVAPDALTNDFRVRMAYASTIIRYTPMPAPGP